MLDAHRLSYQNANRRLYEIMLMEPVDGEQNLDPAQARLQSQSCIEPFVACRVQLLVNASNLRRPNP